MDLFSFSGRANRMEFWLVGVGLTLFQALIVMLMGVAGSMALAPVLEPGQRTVAISVLSVIIVLAFYWPITAVAVRRSHDRNISGWWYGLYAVFTLAMAIWDQSLTLRAVADNSPEAVAAGILTLLQLLIYLFFVVILGMLPGTRGPNRFGAPPKSRQDNYRAPSP